MLNIDSHEIVNLKYKIIYFQYFRFSWSKIRMSIFQFLCLGAQMGGSKSTFKETTVGNLRPQI